MVARAYPGPAPPWATLPAVDVGDAADLGDAACVGDAVDVGGTPSRRSVVTCGAGAGGAAEEVLTVPLTGAPSAAAPTRAIRNR
jgi:hypothetical protein